MSVGGILPRRDRPRVKKPKTLTRLIWSGKLYTKDDALILEIGRGVWKRETDEQGEIVSDSRDPLKWCMANIGNRFVVSGKAIESNAVVEVLRIEPGWPEKLTVRALTDGIECGAVHVQKAGGQ